MDGAMSELNDSDHFQALFENAPISLWEEDFSGIKRLFDGLRQRGVKLLECHLAENPDFAHECLDQIIVTNVNQCTLSMFGATSKADLQANLGKIFREGVRQHWANELLALWNGNTVWTGEGINYTIQGEPLDILLAWRLLPGAEQSWEKVLVSLEDITSRKRAERQMQALFEASPISLLEEDYSGVKACFDALRAQGVTNLEAYIRNYPRFVTQCMGLINVLNVNQKTLSMFGAISKEHFVSSVDQIFRDEMGAHFAKELVDLWNGRLAYERDGINYSLSGDPINIHLDFRIMPGHEESFDWALVAIQDISARKKAEDYLRYLGTHDVMTGLYNRAYFEDLLLRLEKERREPVSIIIADLNELKNTNDTLGHQAGDALIRRAAEVLKANFDDEQIAARIGGDEFAIILPGLGEQAAAETITHLQELVLLNNKFYHESELSVSMGAATNRPGLSLEKVISLADHAMYNSKSQHHHRRSADK
jgi:diguanylate cyclase (GGDEF)-like protein